MNKPSYHLSFVVPSSMHRKLRKTRTHLQKKNPHAKVTMTHTVRHVIEEGLKKVYGEDG